MEVGDLVLFDPPGKERTSGIILGTLEPGTDIVPYHAGRSLTDDWRHQSVGVPQFIIWSNGLFYRLSPGQAYRWKLELVNGFDGTEG